MSDSTERTMTLGFVLALVVLVVNALLSSWGIRALVSTNALVVHTHEAISQLEEIALTLREAEVGQRGYIITGEEAYAPRSTGLPQSFTGASRGSGR